jgi:hypothetical protein
VPRGQRDGSLRPYSRVFQTGAATFLSSSSSVVLTRLSAPRSRPTTTFSGSAGNTFPQERIAIRVHSARYTATSVTRQLLPHVWAP